MNDKKLLLVTMVICSLCLLAGYLGSILIIESRSSIIPSFESNEDTKEENYSMKSHNTEEKNQKKYKCINDNYFITATNQYTEETYGHSIKIEKNSIWKLVSEGDNEYMRLEKYPFDTRELFFIWDQKNKIEEHFELIED
ncbi:hypothetical protein [Enterococcus sp. CWB-B31]|uniref:hypothetical protein n=1 Tax=Enterococcus sp. CWB-B31 TaxID=2885159 RepID=UPI001E33309E|nr:hypothetical protein [Enterococcus sp. CWB-B31]MCB5954609.1 hypothetical protein [Enterococcus sp. CWB-B31]